MKYNRKKKDYVIQIKGIQFSVNYVSRQIEGWLQWEDGKIEVCKYLSSATRLTEYDARNTTVTGSDGLTITSQLCRRILLL
jgi:hypothetical protein